MQEAKRWVQKNSRPRRGFPLQVGSASAESVYAVFSIP